MKRTRILTEGGVVIALALILHYFKVFHLLEGGSITAGSMIPLIIYAIRRGPKWGILAGCVFGVLQMLLDGYAFHPLSFLLDYVIAFGILGLAGINKKSNASIMLCSAGAIVLRWASHVISGVLVFASYASEGQSVWEYSIIYNSSYMVPELVITLVLLALLLFTKAKKKIFEV